MTGQRATTAGAPPLVSVLLLTRDGGERLGAVLAALRLQEAPFDFDIVAVDSGSRDGTVDRLEDAGATVIRIAAGEFNHGATRNAGIAACRGSFIAMLVQDAEPDTADWLARLVQPLLEDDTLAGTYGRQVAPAGASAVARGYLSRYAAGSAAARLQSLPSAGAFRALSPWQQLDACTFDNVSSCIRKSAWACHPFQRVPIAEDLEWARDVMLAGAQIRYVPEARVRHLHDRPAGYELRRTYLVHQRVRQLFGLQTIPTAAHLVRSVAVSFVHHAQWVLRDGASPKQKFRELPRASALALALPLGQYLGAKSADSGRELLRARGI